MKLIPNANIPLFLQAVETCRGDVHYLTPEGDDLNLKSTLGQFLFAAVVDGLLNDLSGEISFENHEDRFILQEYLLCGTKVNSSNK